MFSDYFEEWEVKPEYSKEFISLWSGWLGKENYHKLDEVTENEWGRFNSFLKSISKKYSIEKVDFEAQSITKVDNIETLLSSYSESMNKDSSMFTNIVLPELECVISEEWDYTYIIWHKKNGAVEALSPLIESDGLKHFHD
ncbi:hypothetical protein OA92_15885 [Marinomonas sp. SBI22]|uniref:hypothetical protein n=1 Tax=unclassified Marinomonas TaxID=196814 RepID=UPI0007AF1E07|nr:MULTISPECIES: hypothetical protein [unclassified Marinomonas]KZM41041.1 hypothetical protein OA92_15885 [Marinomonas sp. SBI22]KZM42881.1 hypothetical protein OA91_14085 [Marinomonas sp. SBI8L]